MSKLYPKISQWYQDVIDGQLFKVVAIDDASGNIGIQYLDGEISEIDSDAWQEMVILTAEPPEDWGSPYELNPEDGFDNDSVFQPDNGSDPLSTLEANDYGSDE